MEFDNSDSMDRFAGVGSIIDQLCTVVLRVVGGLLTGLVLFRLTRFLIQIDPPARKRGAKFVRACNSYSLNIFIVYMLGVRNRSM